MIGKRAAAPAFDETQKRQKLQPETPLRDHINLNSVQTNEWEPKSLQKDIKSLLASLPKPQTQSYQVSDE